MRLALALTSLLVLGFFAPLAGAAVPNGCTPAGTLAYACAQEESDGCSGFTALGGGVSATAGFALGGFTQCGDDENGRPTRTEYVLASASVGTVFVSALWLSGPAGCSTTITTTVGSVPTGCPAGAPPSADWGDLLP